MKQDLFFKKARKWMMVNALMGITMLTAQERVVIYQQDFDGNNGDFTHGTILSTSTAVNGWKASSTTQQFTGNYRHLWNIADIQYDGMPGVSSISGKSLGVGFFVNSTPYYEDGYFAYYSEEPVGSSWLTTRWAYIPISTTGFQNIKVEFKYRMDGEVYENVVYDYGTVNTSINGGTNWTMDTSAGQGGVTSEHGTFNSGLYYGNPEIQTATLTLDSSRDNQQNFVLAFRFVEDGGYGTYGSFIIDDIVVTGEAIPMAASDVNKASLSVYRDGDDFIVSSPNKLISKVEIYDASGKLVVSQLMSAKESRITSEKLVKGVFVVKATLDNGQVLTKKITR